MTENETRGRRCRFSPHARPQERQRQRQCWRQQYGRRSECGGVGRRWCSRLGRQERRDPVLLSPGDGDAVPPGGGRSVVLWTGSWGNFQCQRKEVVKDRVPVSRRRYIGAYDPTLPRHKEPLATGTTVCAENTKTLLYIAEGVAEIPTRLNIFVVPQEWSA